MNDEQPTLDELRAFVTVATRKSFRKAAGDLGSSPSTLSHLLRKLEARLDVRLLHRTTRSVSCTEAGERFLAKLGPMLQELAHALETLDDDRARPTGTLRINTGRIGARYLLGHVVPRFRALHPEVKLDLVNEESLVDIVAAGFDAGVRLRESVPEDMVVVPFGGDTRLLVVASPAYWKLHPKPKLPRDLASHDCIRLRLPSGKIYRWELEKRGELVRVDVTGALTLDDAELIAEACADGLGVGLVWERVAESYFARRALTAALVDWCPPFPGMCLYYPGHRHVPPALRAFVAVLKASGKARRGDLRSPT